MVLPTDMEGELCKRHGELCNKLNLDLKITNEAWQTLQEIIKNYTLEGDPLHWMACAIYIANWKVSTKANQSQVNVMSQNNTNINFKNLLSNCNLSLAQFFHNIKPWGRMAQVQEEFMQKINKLEKSITITLNIFEKYQSLFKKIFIAPEPQEPEVKHPRNRKQRTTVCTPLKVFEFVWTLFITIKNDSSKYKEDLVSLLHLLIAVCDWAFKNAFVADRRDLLNPKFKGLPEDWINPDYEIPKETPCIIPFLCDDAITEVKYIKAYLLKQSLKSIFDKGILIGGEMNDLDVFDAAVFDRNYKNLSNTYENEFLEKGELDERILLAEFKRKILENVQNQNSVLAPTSQRHSESGRDDSSTAEFPREMVTDQSCISPASGKRYLQRDSHDSNSGVTATEGIANLYRILSGRQPGPSEKLVQLFEGCIRDPTERINGIVTRLGDKFKNACEKTDLSNRQLQLTTTLFYKLIENILENEKMIHSDISGIVERDAFYECIFACSLEIVLFSFNSKKEFQFPFVLETLGVQAYNFIKVIELIIRLKDRFSRVVIKHLNSIEERILSSEIWKSNSFLWEAIRLSQQEIPKFEETALPDHILENDQSDTSTLRNMLSTESKQLQSPGPSATDRFQSPVTHNSQLIILSDRSGATKLIPFTNSNETSKVNSSAVAKSPENAIARPKRTGGLSIVFRKFYNLSGERLEHLCGNLGISSIDKRKKIWTVFEELVRKNNCELMKDRHLDQLLMCAIYMIFKLTKTQKPFTDIMKSYRNQPQATSDIYRDVLISSKGTQEIDGQIVEVPEVRGDLILFYNKIIIQAMKKFAENFVDKGNNQNTDLLLSPLPVPRRQTVSPKVQVCNNVFVKPLESPTLNTQNGKTYNYYFCRSPSKDLKDINKAVRDKVTGKRLLVEGEVELPNAKRLANKKVQSLIEDRRNNQNLTTE